MIKVYDNFLDEEYFIYLQKRSDEIFESHQFTCTNSDWSNDVVLDSSTVHVYSETCEGKVISDRIRKKLNTEYSLTDAMFYYWMPGSHIPWHDDRNHLGGITIYLNEYWNVNHGGIFMTSDMLFDHNKDNTDLIFEKISNSNIKGIFPKRNRAIQQLGSVWHSVSVLSNNSQVRKTIQIFFKKSA